LRPGLSTSKTCACAGLHNPGNPAPVDIAPGAGDAVNTDGRREVLGRAIGAAEAETFWIEFLRKLKRRGLAGVKLVISDAHEGIKAAVARVFRATWQRCRVGLLKKSVVAEPVRAIRRSLTGSRSGGSGRGGAMAGLFLRPGPCRWHRMSQEGRPRAA
jgi:Transposase, Mutator family